MPFDQHSRSFAVPIFTLSCAPMMVRAFAFDATVVPASDDAKFSTSVSLGKRVIISKYMDFCSLCRYLDLVGEMHGCLHPKNVGLLFFCLEPVKHFPSAQIDVIHFSDAAEEKPSIKEMFSGPLPHQLRAALLHIRNSVITETVIKQPDVAEAKRYFNYSYESIAKALAIAVCCKDYETDRPVEVHVLPDRIEITSCSDAEQFADDMGSEIQCHNPRIYELMRGLQLIKECNAGNQKTQTIFLRRG